MITYNIKFPISDDVITNSYFAMSRVTKDAFSSDLLLLLLTQKGERYYEPDYGTDLLKFIFEPNDNTTANDVEAEIKRVVSLYIPNLTINNVSFNWKTDNDNQPISENQLNVNVNFTYKEDAFSEEGSLDINF